MSEVIITTKVCTECEVEKNFDCFSKRKKAKDGLKGKCKDCCKIEEKQYAENNKKNYIPNKLNLISKKCGTCKIIKSINNFSIQKRTKDGFRSQCKDCCKEDRENNKNKIKKRKSKYYDGNKTKIKIKVCNYRQNNKQNYIPNKYNLTSKKCGKCKIEKDISYFYTDVNCRDGFANNCYECKNEYNKNRMENDPVFKFRNLISKAVRSGLKSKGGSKEGVSFFKAIGYTPQQLMNHLMSHPEKEWWMNENNNGVYRIESWDEYDPLTWVWHIDHIKPHSKFKYTSMNDFEFKECWSLKNLRPYSAPKNLSDGDRR